MLIGLYIREETNESLILRKIFRPPAISIPNTGAGSSSGTLLENFYAPIADNSSIDNNTEFDSLKKEKIWKKLDSYLCLQTVTFYWAISAPPKR